MTFLSFRQTSYLMSTSFHHALLHADQQETTSTLRPVQKTLRQAGSIWREPRTPAWSKRSTDFLVCKLYIGKHLRIVWHCSLKNFRWSSAMRFLPWQRVEVLKANVEDLISLFHPLMMGMLSAAVLLRSAMRQNFFNVFFFLKQRRKSGVISCPGLCWELSPCRQIFFEKYCCIINPQILRPYYEKLPRAIATFVTSQLT